MRIRAFLLPLATIALVACNEGTTTSPTTESTATATVASASSTDTFIGQLLVRGTLYFTFDVTQYGTVEATLTSVSGAGVPTTVQVRLGVGTLTDTTTDEGTVTSCSLSTSLLTKAGSTAQVTTTLSAGTYCVSVGDVGNLFAPADVAVSIAHP